MHSISFRFFIAASLGCTALACAHGSGARTGSQVQVDVPARITEESYPEAVRTLHGLPLDAPGRAELRERIVEYLARQTSSILEAGDYDAVVEHFGEMSSLYRPAEFGEGNIPPGLERPAAFLLENSRPRGDEARALASLFVLAALRPKDAHYSAEYRQVANWGRQARAAIQNALERYTRLIGVWEEHGRLTPAPEVLERAARLHVERQQVIVQAMQSGEALRGMGGSGALQLFGHASGLIRRAPFDVAAIYLQHGDVASAITHVKAMGDAAGTQGRLLRVLEEAREPATGGDAIFELAEAYREARPEVTLGLCRFGLRSRPEDPRFPVCLGRVAAARNRFGDATAWYARAIELAPDERDLYDEALTQLNDFIQRGLFDTDPTEAREASRHAERILKDRLQRWPGSEPPVAPEQLHLLVGLLEMNSGNADRARKRFEASLAVKPTPEALLQLGFLAERTGAFDKAAEYYRRALDMTPRQDDRDAMSRAEILEHLGNSFRKLDNEAQATRMYRQAVDLWGDVADELEGRQLARVRIRRGVLMDRLGEHDEATSEFRQSMRAAPDWREGYASILSHLVISEPDPELALEVFRRAQRQLTLEPEWKVYFALWVIAIDGRAGVAPAKEASELLDELSEGQAWWGRLAKFGAGELPFDELLAEAGDRGQKAEAYFYEAARRLAAGDTTGAQQLFERVLATHMVNFYEFAMAQELLARTTAADASAGPSGAASKP